MKIYIVYYTTYLYSSTIFVLNKLQCHEAATIRNSQSSKSNVTHHQSLGKQIAFHNSISIPH